MWNQFGGAVLLMLLLPMQYWKWHCNPHLH
jgi:hypothetical protein